MRENPCVATTVMRGIGFGPGKMPVVINSKDVAKGLGLRWYGTDGGCCDIQDQIDGKILDKISSSTAGQHRFVPFYRHELAELKSEMELSTDGTLLLVWVSRTYFGEPKDGRAGFLYRYRGYMCWAFTV